MHADHFVESRDRLLGALLEHAYDDEQCVGAALLGSAARGSVDEWSDIDLGLRLAPGSEVDEVAHKWTDWLSSQIEVSDVLDVRAWGALYRVFLCANGLQVDLSLWPWDKFRSVNGEAMKLVFGEALPADRPQPPARAEHAQMAWLYALHARSAIRRGRALQADLMLTHWRDRITALAAIRLGLNPSSAREAHLLPRELQTAIEEARPADLGEAELLRALRSTGELYLAELERDEPLYAAKLRDAVEAVTR